MVHSFQDKSFDSELLNVIYRILRLSSAGMPVLRIVLETASRTVELALQSDQYSAEQINLILRQASRVCTRDRARVCVWAQLCVCVRVCARVRLVACARVNACMHA